MRILTFMVASVLLAGCVSAGEKPILVMKPDEIFIDFGPRRLAEAAKRGDRDLINKLVDEGVDVNARGKYGVTPIFSALQCGSLEGMKVLLKRGADPNAIWETGDSVVHIAAGMKDPQFLRMLLDHGGSSNLVNPRIQETPIFEAVSPEGKINLDALIHEGANVNFQNRLGQTPMMIAVALNQYDVVYKLLDADADYRIRDKLGKGNGIQEYIKIEGAIDKSGDQYRWRQKVIDFLKEEGFWVE